MTSLVLRYAALIVAGITFCNVLQYECMLAEQRIPTLIASILQYAVMAGGLFFGIYKIRQLKFTGGLTYGQAFYAGLLITIATAMGVGLCSLLYFQLVRPDFNILIIPIEQKAMLASGLKQEQILKNIQSLRETPATQGVLMAALVSTMLIMTIMNSVLASLLRTKDTFSANPFANPDKKD